MKKFKNLMEGLPSKKIVFAFGRFQPPTIGHSLLVSAVKQVASKAGADHVIFASKTHDKKQNPLPVDRKVYYLNKMFPATNFVAANDQIRTFVEAATVLSKKYKHLVMVAGSDRIPEYRRILEKYNGDVFTFDSVEVVSAGERDPDSDTASGMSGTKMREAASKGDFTAFRRGLPSTLTTVDSKRLMNEIREGLGLEVIKESVVIEKSDLRERYHAGAIFALGDIVESAGTVYRIKKRGSNHVLLQCEDGSLVSKWLHDITESTKNFKLLEGLNEMKYTSADKIKVARVIAAALGIENVEKTSSAEQLINTALRKIKSKPMRPEYLEVLHKMLTTADDAGIEYDKRLVPSKVAAQTPAVTEAVAPFNPMDLYLKAIADGPNVSILSNYRPVSEAVSQAGLGKKDNESDKAADFELDHKFKVGEIGDSITSPKETHASRKMKVIYATEDVDTAEYKIKKYVDGQGVTRTRKIRPHRIEFSTSHPKTVDQDDPDYMVKGTNGIRESIPSTTEDNLEDLNSNDIGSKLTSTAPVGPLAVNAKAKSRFVKEESEDEDSEDTEDEPTEAELDHMVDSVKDEEDILDAYDDSELALVDDDTGEHVEDIEGTDVNEEVINEVLSRMERIKAKVKFARSATKRERRIKIVLKSRSSSTAINARARHMAIKLMKLRIAKKPLAQLSIGEKERVERIIAKRKKIINRLAMKLAPRIRMIENNRLTHKKFTK